MKLIELIPIIDKKCKVEIYIYDYRLNSYNFDGFAKDIPERFLHLDVKAIMADQRIHDGIHSWSLKIQVKYIRKNMEEQEYD